MYKKMFCVLLSVTLVFSENLASHAMSNSSESRNFDAIIIREDISHEEAMQDNTYDVMQGSLNNSGNISTLSANEVYWDVWGAYLDRIDGGVRGAIPVGFSAHKNGDTVLDTYHYTRTYLGSLVKRGDSGRCWGTGTVEARGSFCDYDVWANHTQYVKYGTESN